MTPQPAQSCGAKVKKILNAERNGGGAALRTGPPKATRVSS